MEHVDLVTDSI